MKLFDIAQGWARYYMKELGLLNPHVAKEAERRLSICNTCEFRVNNTCSKKKSGKNVVTDMLVNGCGCNVKAKTLADASQCPAGKWKKT